MSLPDLLSQSSESLAGRIAFHMLDGFDLGEVGSRDRDRLGLRGGFPTWYANLGKRQVKSPKVYIRDSGLLHTLLDIRDRQDLERHPKVGASWEGHALHQIARRLGALPQECYFWSIHSGGEIDLLWVRGRRRWGFEFKRTSSPVLSRSLMNAVETLKLQRAFVVHAGETTFPLHKKVTALAVGKLLEDLPRP